MSEKMKMNTGEVKTEWDELAEAPEMLKEGEAPEALATGEPVEALTEGDTPEALEAGEAEGRLEAGEKEPPFYVNDPRLQELSIAQYNTEQEIARLTIAVGDNRDHISPTMQRNREQALAVAEAKDRKIIGAINLRVAEVKKIGPEKYEESLAAKRLARAREEAEKNKRNEGIRLISFNSAELRDLDRQFQRNFARHEEEGSKMSKEEFEKWEDEYAFYWQPIEQRVSSLKLDIYEQAEAMAEIVPFATDTVEHQSIEAQAGEYFFERKNDLLRAIRDSDRVNKDKDERAVLDFWHTVRDHIDYKYMKQYEVEAIGSKAYEENRTKHHNAVVAHLNELNYIARSYGTRQFTARSEFWTSGIRKELQTPEMSRKMRYDRDVVSKFYQVAFKEDIRVREKKLEEEMEAMSGTLYNESDKN